jgi:hypothetical protein
VCSPKQNLVPNNRRARAHADTPLYKPSLCQHINKSTGVAIYIATPVMECSLFKTLYINTPTHVHTGVALAFSPTNHSPHYTLRTYILCTTATATAWGPWCRRQAGHAHMRDTLGTAYSMETSVTE